MHTCIRNPADKPRNLVKCNVCHILGHNSLTSDLTNKTMERALRLMEGTSRNGESLTAFEMFIRSG